MIALILNKYILNPCGLMLVKYAYKAPGVAEFTPAKWKLMPIRNMLKNWKRDHAE